MEEGEERMDGMEGGRDGKEEGMEGKSEKKLSLWRLLPPGCAGQSSTNLAINTTSCHCIHEKEEGKKERKTEKETRKE